MDPTKGPDERVNPELLGGRASLLASAILHLLFAVVLASVGDDSDPPSLRNAFRAEATVNVCLGAVFIGLWAWAKQSPMGASVTGLLLFFAVHGMVAVLFPESLWFTILAKILVLFLMIRSVLAARAARAWDKMEAPKQAGPR